MKRSWTLIPAIVLAVGCAGTAQAGELSPSTLEVLSLVAPQEHHSPMTPAKENSAAIGGPYQNAVCQPGTFQNYCKEIWGVSQGRCGANTWRYTQCQQYKNSAGKWYYQNCGTVQEVCSAPGGAECIPCV